ncbi:MAG: chromosome segregation and condensation protein ScpA [Thermoleophilia bacterium]|nr:chromosome segregation and condensation protein ScpA [Thermoleophilia bacterium]
MRPAALQLDLETFEGPFDLLCTVLLRRELSVEDVPLAEVVVGYVARLAEEQRVDPDTAGEFLLLVAGLMEIKSRELLSVEAELELEDPAAIEAQGDMLERLVRYSTFRKAAEWLGQSAGQEHWWRVASRAPRRAPGVYDGPVMDPAVLARSMGVLLAQPDVDVRHLVGRHASVHEMTGRLLGVLRQRRTFQLDEAIEGLTRLDQAVAFVAALELCKAGQVELVQEDRFGPITVNRREVAAHGSDDAAGTAGDEQDMGVQTA